MESVIAVNSLVKVFSDKTVLDHLQFKVYKGEIFGFLGPSGAGKTVTIKILTGQLSPTDGSAYVFDVPSTEINSPQYLKKLGIMTDNSGLYQRLTIYDNLKLYCELYRVSVKRIGDVLEMVQLQDVQKKNVATLSKGMTQRVILARALLHEPELLFLDEPTAALDPVNSKHIHKGLLELKEKGTTIFLTTHDMNEAESVCDRVAFLDKGKIQLLNKPKRLRQRFSDATMTLELVDGSTVVLENGSENAQKVYEYMLANQIVSHTHQ